MSRQSKAIRSLIGVAAVGALGAWVFHGSSYRTRLRTSPAGASLQAGRETYIAEGCIHCHTQYVRPGTRDVLLWGPAIETSLVLRQAPPLIGNRRQGPDLMNVGNRRSPAWNQAHLRNPRSLVPGSRMPSYEYLFAAGDVRGESLVAYLCSLGAGTEAARKALIQQWKPVADPKCDVQTASALFRTSCVSCHGEHGTGDGPLAGLFGGPSKCRLGSSPQPGANSARVIKFGIEGTSMPGYETLSDAEILGLEAYVATLRRPRE